MDQAILFNNQNKIINANLVYESCFSFKPRMWRPCITMPSSSTNVATTPGPLNIYILSESWWVYFVIKKKWMKITPVEWYLWNRCKTFVRVQFCVFLFLACLFILVSHMMINLNWCFIVLPFIIPYIQKYLRGTKMFTGDWIVTYQCIILRIP